MGGRNCAHTARIHPDDRFWVGFACDHIVRGNGNRVRHCEHGGCKCTTSIGRASTTSMHMPPRVTKAIMDLNCIGMIVVALSCDESVDSR
jgi:hypothetical protein